MNKVTWLRANVTAPYYMSVNYGVISIDKSHLWYSASRCYVLRKCVILNCVILISYTGY